MPDLGNLTVSVTEHGAQSTRMYLPSQTELNGFISTIGFAMMVWQLPAVMTVCALSFSSWRLQMKKYRHHLNTGHEVAKINLEGETVTPCKACLACAGKKNCVWRNDIFLNKEVFVVGSTYWNIAYGKLPGESLKDNEGVETMKNLGKNISWILDRLS